MAEQDLGLCAAAQHPFRLAEIVLLVRDESGESVQDLALTSFDLDAVQERDILTSTERKNENHHKTTKKRVPIQNKKLLKKLH